MFEYTVMNCCSVHCTTQPGAKRGSDIGFNLCTAPNYLTLMSEYFKCILATLRISRGDGSVLGVRSNPELEHSSERGECRDQV